MDPETAPGATLSPEDAARVGALLDAVVRLVDEGEMTATSPERAHLVGSASAMKLYSSLGSAKPPKKS